MPVTLPYFDTFSLLRRLTAKRWCCCAVTSSWSTWDSSWARRSNSVTTLKDWNRPNNKGGRDSFSPSPHWQPHLFTLHFIPAVEVSGGTLCSWVVQVLAAIVWQCNKVCWKYGGRIVKSVFALMNCCHGYCPRTRRAKKFLSNARKDPDVSQQKGSY